MSQSYVSKPSLCEHVQMDLIGSAAAAATSNACCLFNHETRNTAIRMPFMPRRAAHVALWPEQVWMCRTALNLKRQCTYFLDARLVHSQEKQTWLDGVQFSTGAAFASNQ